MFGKLVKRLVTEALRQLCAFRVYRQRIGLHFDRLSHLTDMHRNVCSGDSTGCHLDTFDDAGFETRRLHFYRVLTRDQKIQQVATAFLALTGRYHSPFLGS